jgi:uncharacterized metal-binding protein
VKVELDGWLLFMSIHRKKSIYLLASIIVDGMVLKLIEDNLETFTFNKVYAGKNTKNIEVLTVSTGNVLVDMFSAVEQQIESRSSQKAFT